MVGPNLPFGGLACGLVLGPLPSFEVGFDLHGRPLLAPAPPLELVDWPPCPLELDLHQEGLQKHNGKL